VEVRRLIDDADPRHEPLEVFEQEVPVLEEAEHAQVHRDAPDEPELAGALTLRASDARAEPEIHRRRGKKQRRERRIPRAIENVARCYEQVFARVPGPDAPVRGHHGREENDEGKRIEKHWKLLSLPEKAGGGQDELFKERRSP